MDICGETVNGVSPSPDTWSSEDNKHEPCNTSPGTVVTTNMNQVTLPPGAVHVKRNANAGDFSV